MDIVLKASGVENYHDKNHFIIKNTDLEKAKFKVNGIYLSFQQLLYQFDFDNPYEIGYEDGYDDGINK
jgi:hypothetical protein